MEKFQQFELNKIVVPGKFTMSPIELKDYIDFEVKRVYFITKPEDKTLIVIKLNKFYSPTRYLQQ